MNCIPTALPGVLVLEPRLIADERGFFYESYNRRVFAELTGATPDFVQDNHSQSVRGVLRGLHYQVGAPQAKLVRVAAGEVFDVVVDLRRGSPTFGRSVCTVLSAANHRQLWVPAGCAHGFLTLSAQADMLYKTTDYWRPAQERTLLWSDPALAIAWPLEGAPVLSDKDRQGLPLALAEPYA